MSASDPAWLQGLTPSPCSALAWENHDQRQFCVHPFYPNGNRDDLQRYAMRGRALSNGESYPVPPSTYRLDLVQCNPDPDGTDWYQWNAQARGRAPYIVPIEMHKIRAEEYGRDPDGTRSWISKYPLSSHLNSWKIGGDMVLVSHSGPRKFTLMSHCGQVTCSFTPWETTGFQSRRQPWARDGLKDQLHLSRLIYALFSSKVASGAPPRGFGTANGVQRRNMPVQRQQAQEGDTFVGGAATYVHGEQAAGEVVNEVRKAIKETIAFNLMPAKALASVLQETLSPELRILKSFQRRQCSGAWETRQCSTRWTTPHAHSSRGGRRSFPGDTYTQTRRASQHTGTAHRHL